MLMQIPEIFHNKIIKTNVRIVRVNFVSNINILHSLLKIYEYLCPLPSWPHIPGHPLWLCQAFPLWLRCPVAPMMHSWYVWGPSDSLGPWPPDDLWRHHPIVECLKTKFLQKLISCEFQQDCTWQLTFQMKYTTFSHYFTKSQKQN